VVIRDFNVVCIWTAPAKADAPLLIDPNAHLSTPIPFQCLQPIAGGIAQILERPRGIELAQLAQGTLLDIDGKPAARLPTPDTFGLLIAK
jgi:hypothetical protein